MNTVVENYLRNSYGQMVDSALIVAVIDHITCLDAYHVWVYMNVPIANANA